MIYQESLPIGFKLKRFLIDFLYCHVNCTSTDIAAVLEGAVQHIASRRFEVGGIDLTKLLAQELGKSNPMVNLSLSDVEKLKEQFSCCAEDEVAYDRMLRSCETEEHTLPDGQVCIFPLCFLSPLVLA